MNPLSGPVLQWIREGYPDGVPDDETAALAAVAAMIRGHTPHAILLVGPPGVGKSTLATDLAAGLFCTADDVTVRPCGACRGSPEPRCRRWHRRS